VFVTAPGWYPDPEDAALLRYFNGERWTGERQPAAASRIDEPALHAAGNGFATEALPSYRTESHSTEPLPAHPPATRYQPPAFPSPAPYVDPPPASEHSQPLPRVEDPPPVPRRRAVRSVRRRRRTIVIAVVAAVLAGGLTGGWFALRKSSSTTFTFEGKKVDQPATTIRQAEKSLDAIVASRHGVKSADTRCYFAVPQNAPKGAKKTDVDSALRCGPVLFVDGDAARTYLTFPLTSTPASGGDVTLTAAAQPINAQPGLAPVGYILRRPDKRSEPSDAQLTVPAPQAAQPNTLVAADLGNTTLPDAPSSALMVSLRGGVRLTKAGPIERFDTGDAARSAPPGQQLIAFSYTPVPGQVANISPGASQLGVSVNGGAPRRLPALKGTQVVVLAVPAKARVEFVLDADGVRQSLALPTGVPGTTNLAVLRRSSIDATLAVNQPITIKFTRPGSVTNLAGTLTVTHALLGYWTDDGKHHASNGGRALLWMDFRFQAPQQTNETGIDAPLLRLTPAGGQPIAAKDVDPTNRVFAVFDVPANFTKGTVTVSGTESGNPTISVTTPITFQVSVPN
jgi:hypothetical protein